MCEGLIFILERRLHLPLLTAFYFCSRCPCIVFFPALIALCNWYLHFFQFSGSPTVWAIAHAFRAACNPVQSFRLGNWHTVILGTMVSNFMQRRIRWLPPYLLTSSFAASWNMLQYLVLKKSCRSDSTVNSLRLVFPVSVFAYRQEDEGLRHHLVRQMAVSEGALYPSPTQCVSAIKHCRWNTNLLLSSSNLLSNDWTFARRILGRCGHFSHFLSLTAVHRRVPHFTGAALVQLEVYLVKAVLWKWNLRRYPRWVMPRI